MSSPNSPTDRVRLFSRRRVLAGTAVAMAAGSTLIAGSAMADPDTSSGKTRRPRPTIVLVHGAFTDASSWHGVIGRLQDAGYTVIAPANPLRDLTSDSAYIAAVVKSVKGPVVLAGHSYGGAVITNAAREADNVTGLVYLAAFAPDEGESPGSISADYPETPIGQSLAPLPLPDGTADLLIAPDKFHHVFAQDIPAADAARLASAQRPIAEAAFGGKTGEPAWKSLPSWFLVATEDHAIHPDAQRDMAERAHAKKTVKVASGHAVSLSHPGKVAALIRTAAKQARDS
nr:alpha/beta hydrolase [Stackebrandtia nassauensis]